MSHNAWISISDSNEEPAALASSVASSLAPSAPLLSHDLEDKAMIEDPEAEPEAPISEEVPVTLGTVRSATTPSYFCIHLGGTRIRIRSRKKVLLPRKRLASPTPIIPEPEPKRARSTHTASPTLAARTLGGLDPPIKGGMGSPHPP
ncbi:hypothetical protein L1987_20817 [Smallanthus sonchifolius]|uniref:Uncharacterized protein n=1 Tax=Smallanthus sonchifolius TaxID=185202 RepID=A0ACB9ITE7_9ASTR|nr:hypothetical protein L1987_20817 [Smallanthus sonchifolius]